MKAGEPFWDEYPKGGEQRRKPEVLSGANHSGQSFPPKSSFFLALTLGLEGAAHRQRRPPSQVSKQLLVSRLL